MICASRQQRRTCNRFEERLNAPGNKMKATVQKLQEELKKDEEGSNSHKNGEGSNSHKNGEGSNSHKNGEGSNSHKNGEGSNSHKNGPIVLLTMTSYVAIR